LLIAMPPSGDTWSRDAALQAFKAAFLEWIDEMPNRMDTDDRIVPLFNARTSPT
jgi:hypothetical protein